jgi:26S proteasome regulatory subunit N9
MSQPSSFITRFSTQCPQPIVPLIEQIAHDYKKGLYHQVAVGLVEVTKEVGSGAGETAALLSLYDEFVVSLHGKVNELTLARVTDTIVRRTTGESNDAAIRRYKDAVASVASLDDTSVDLYPEVEEEEETADAMDTDEGKAGRRGRENTGMTVHSLYANVPKEVTARDAFTFLVASLADAHLHAGSLVEAKRLLAIVKERLGPEVDVVVHARYHLARSHLYKLQQQAPEFYAAGLAYLDYSSGGEDLSHADRVLLVFDMSLAALVGERVFNFGELISSPVFSVLQDSPGQAWIGELLSAFSAGDVAACNALVTKHAKHMAEQPVLVSARTLVAEKISVLALVDAAFRLPPGNRRLSFADVATATSLPLSDVEPLVMRTCSLGLIRASIDQVDEVVHIQWVKPRVLREEEVLALRERLAQWGEKVQATIKMVEQATPA